MGYNQSLNKLCLFILFFLNQAAYSAYCDIPYFNEFIQAYEKYGNAKYMIQEEITQSSHVRQAAYIAHSAGAPEDIVIGLLMHDVGQVITEEHAGDAEYLHSKHDDFGAEWLRRNGFPQDVVDLVQYHTLSKVILCEREPDYYSHLSEASKISFDFQKKKYARPEKKSHIAYLKNHERLQDYLAARRCDEMAKIADPAFDKAIPDFGYYSQMAERVRAGKGKTPSDPNWQEKTKSLHQVMKDDRLVFEATILKVTNEWRRI